MADSFGKNEKITNFVNVWMLEGPIQVETTSSFGPFQIYFYKNLFFLDENNKKLTKVALEILLNVLFTLDRDNNEHIINEHIRQRHKNAVTYIDYPVPINNLSLSKIGDFGHIHLLW